VGEIGATQGPTSSDLSESQRSFRRCNPILDQRNAGNVCRRLLLRAENRRRSIQGAPLFPTRVETALKRLPICVRLPSLADGANGALNLRAPSLDSVGGSFGLVILPTPESGAAHSSSPGPSAIDSAPGRGAASPSEQVSLRSPAQRASGSDSSASGAGERLFKSDSFTQPFVTSGEAFVLARRARSEAEPQANALTVNSANNRDRSAGLFTASPTYRPASSFPAKRGTASSPTRVRLASVGPSAARTQDADLGGAKGKAEDAAARSLSAAARGARGREKAVLTDLHPSVAVASPIAIPASGTTDPAASLPCTAGQTIQAVPSSLFSFTAQHPQVMATDFKNCARLACLADGADGALALRAPDKDAGGPSSLVLLPAPESGATRVSSSGTALGRGAVTRRARSEAEAPPSALTATATDNPERSAGTFASSQTYRPASSLSTKFPADLHASVSVTVSSHDATRGTADPASSISPGPTHSPQPTEAGRWAVGGGGWGRDTHLRPFRCTRRGPQFRAGLIDQQTRPRGMGVLRTSSTRPPGPFPVGVTHKRGNQ
jgi:hypothetical protein